MQLDITLQCQSQDEDIHTWTLVLEAPEQDIFTASSWIGCVLDNTCPQCGDEVGEEDLLCSIEDALADVWAGRVFRSGSSLGLSVMYHAAPCSARQSILASGLRAGFGGGFATGATPCSAAPLVGVYLAKQPGNIGLPHAGWELLS